MLFSHRPTLATRFGAGTRVLRADMPLGEDQMRGAAPSIFAPGKHESRSARYAYIPTIEVLRGLAAEGFRPYMVAQGRSRSESKAGYTKHMIRMRHAGSDGAAVQARQDVNEIILINSHDGASAYQLLAGRFRFVCHNGLISGETSHDIRIPHKGDAFGEVIDGAVRVLDHFETVDASVDGMKALTLDRDEERAFATAALALRFGERGQDEAPAPVTAEQLTQANRAADVGPSLWLSLQRVQENVMRGGLTGRSAQGRRMTTRPVQSIDRNVGLNRALWVLAEEMRRLKAA